MSKMIVIPAKKAYELNISHPLKQFIQQTYSTNLDDYLKSVDALNQLRTEALFKSNRQERLAKLLRYCDQLTAIESKLPISENQIRLAFKWQDAFDKGSLFGRGTLTLSSGIYEKLCVLFNIGACCSDIASTAPLETEEGLKTAAKLYQQAAGCYSYIRDHALTATRSDCTWDLYPESLSCLIAIMLAQAQEVFYLKAVDNKFKDGTIAKLVKQCSDFYADAMKAVQTDCLKDLQKTWLPVLAGKQALFHALSEYHRGEHDLSEQKIGDALARFTKSFELIKVAEQRSSKELNLKPYTSRIQNAYDKAKKDNEFVYHERVPDYKTLPAIEAASLAKITPLKYPTSEDFRDLFSTLVPMTVHNGLQAFKSKRVEILNMEVGKLRQATELMNTALVAWNLPAAIEDAGGKNLVPQSLLDKSSGIKDKGGIEHINRMMAELGPLMQRNGDILGESKRMLNEEESSDTELRTSMKDKWTRTPSRQLTEYLHSEVKQYETIMENAMKANKVIESKYAKNKDGIDLLSKSPHQIGSALPAATAAGALQNTHVIRELRRLMEQVEALKNVREVLESEMKALDNDALNAKVITALTTATNLDEHSVIQNELDELIAPMRKQVRENIQEQEQLMGFIEKANSDFVKEKVHNETSKMREEMLKNLATAADSFNELYNHSEEGNKFYNDLTEILLKFQNKVNDFVFARKTEKDDLMKDIQTNLSRPSSSTNTAAPSRPPPPTPAAASAAPPAGQAPYPTQPAYPYPTMPAMPSNYYGNYYPMPGQQGGAPAAPNPYYPQGYYPPAPGPGGYQQAPPRK